MLFTNIPQNITNRKSESKRWERKSFVALSLILDLKDKQPSHCRIQVTFDKGIKGTALGDTECKGQYTALRKLGKRAVKREPDSDMRGVSLVYRGFYK